MGPKVQQTDLTIFRPFVINQQHHHQLHEAVHEHVSVVLLCLLALKSAFSLKLTPLETLELLYFGFKNKPNTERGADFSLFPLKQRICIQMCQAEL